MIFSRIILAITIFTSNLTFSDTREKILIKDQYGVCFYLIESDTYSSSPWFQRGHSTTWHLYSCPEEKYVASFKEAEIEHHLLTFRGVKVGARKHSEFSILAYIEEDEFE